MHTEQMNTHENRLNQRNNSSPHSSIKNCEVWANHFIKFINSLKCIANLFTLSHFALLSYIIYT